jgi:F-type H+-transporting ATPase subunit delta
MRADAVARRYARALFELSEEQGTVDAAGTALAAIASFLDDERVVRVLTGPVPRDQKDHLLRELAANVDAPPALRDLLLLLSERHRLGHLPMIRGVFDHLVDVRHGRTRATVRSATPLPPEMLQEVTRVFGSVTGKQVLAEVTVDPDLLAGLIVEVDGRVYDGSLRTQLAKLRQQMASGS